MDHGFVQLGINRFDPCSDPNATDIEQAAGRAADAIALVILALDDATGMDGCEQAADGVLSFARSGMLELLTKVEIELIHAISYA